MGRTLLNIKQLLIIVLCAICFNSAFGQISAPGRDWQGVTQYSIGTTQHPIFVFFSTPDNPKLGSLSATFSDGSNSTFKWYKYNPNVPVSNRFQLFGTSDLDVPASNRTSLNAGGYKVEVVRTSDDSTEIYYAWLFVDAVVFSTVFVENTCDFMFLEARTVPDRFTVFYEFFSYYDLSTAGQSIINKLGTNYFKTITWQASSSQIQLPTTSSLSIAIEEPAPLYNSTYTIKLVNPFGRELTITSPEIVAKATKADYDLFINEGDDIAPDWQDGGDEPKGEALLEIKLESKSLNADSIFWNIINDKRFYLRGADSIIWRYKELMVTQTVEVFPPKTLMVPGKYMFEHISINVASGCRDTMYKTVTVDTSFIKADAIPNVFTPNGDGQNDFFILKDAKITDANATLLSIKSFSISIYSRWGKRVYTYTGDPRDWDGWNGKVDGKYGDAPSGVYYYVIEAVGWDGRRFKGGIYKGFLHLFRGEN
jgi:gliding motility-associated-like protein